MTVQPDVFMDRILALPERQMYERSDLLVSAFEVGRTDGLAVYYAPFDAPNRPASVVIVGVTPGWTQMQIAFRTARQELLGGASHSTACAEAKVQASFAGSMRTTLVTMLDAIGLPRCLGISSSLDLFDTHRTFLHTTSTVRYPVFAGDSNYTGSGPTLAKSPMLMDFARTLLVNELREVDARVVVPLGRRVDEALAALENEGLLPRGRRLAGFPHPSGANGHRARQFTERQFALAHQLKQLLCAA